MNSTAVKFLRSIVILLLCKNESVDSASPASYIPRATLIPSKKEFTSRNAKILANLIPFEPFDFARGAWTY